MRNGSRPVPASGPATAAPVGPAAPQALVHHDGVDSTPVGCDLVLVGGVPGAGKTTAIARASHGLGHVATLDPEQVSQWFRRRLPGVPYRTYRMLVHVSHTVRVLVHLLAGPVAGRQLVIHDPGTRTRRRSIYQGLARLIGWRAVLVYVDVDRPAAQDGQRRRGRVVRSFDEHWQSWERLRPALAAAAARDAERDPAASPTVLVDRTEAAGLLRELLTDRQPCPAPGIRSAC